MNSIVNIVAFFFRLLNRRIAWHTLPFPIALLNLVMLRADLRRKNLVDTQRTPAPDPKPGAANVYENRSVDGSYNDLADHGMGQAGSRFGRNFALRHVFGEAPPGVYDPNPRLISEKLLTRREFKPVPHLNVLAAGWLQFMVHDWFSHGKNADPEDDEIPEDLRRPFVLDEPEGGDWHEGPLTVWRTNPDTASDERDSAAPAAYSNFETHWWDASQLYGSTAERIAAVRQDPATGDPVPDGKIHLEDGHLPLLRIAGEDGGDESVELSGVNGNWWVGLSVFHTLFAREHNAVCDALKIEYPDRASDGEWLFNKARLIVAALLAKIHTVEWTPALLNTPTMRFAMRANWWGLLGEDYVRGFGRTIRSEVMGGIIESGTDHHAAPYAMTEEFVAVYRMHSLLPDDFTFRRHDSDALVLEKTLAEVAGKATHGLYNQLSFADVVYSLGTEPPGLLSLDNYPRALRPLKRQAPSGRVVDVAAIDILRDRERGVPRYCEFRRHLRMPVPRSFVELTGGDAETARRLEEVYGDVNKVDLLVGCAAEKWPEGFGFSDTAFRIFILMASRRLKSDRFFTVDYRPEVYTPLGLKWVRDNGMASVLGRHLPELKDNIAGVKNVFFPWTRGTGG